MVGLAVMMRKGLGHFGKAVAATALDFLRDLRMQRRARFAQQLPADYKRELLNVVAEGDLVVVYVRQTWTSRDGKHNKALEFDMFRVQDGKIVEHWDAED